MKRFALAGNPNCGKTTLFNSLTGSTAHVGNWPGVTVDKRDGLYKKCEENVSVVDLPGIYSLSPYTPEEVVARNYILDEKPDCVINIVDATNLERNLYLTTQILEIDVPVVVALNMIDAVEKVGDSIDEKKLQERLGVPVVKISALKETGLDSLMEVAFNESKKPREGVTVLENTYISHLIGDIKIALKGRGVKNPLFHAVKLIENDALEVKMHSETLSMIEEFKTTHYDQTFGDDFEALIADGRYSYISKNFIPALSRRVNEKYRITPSDKTDRVLTHKYFGIPIFLLILFSVFHLTFSENFLYLGSIFNFPSLEEMGLISNGEYVNFGAKVLSCFYDGAVYSPGIIIDKIWNELFVNELFGYLSGVVSRSGAQPWAIGLINGGVIQGVSSVLSFLPCILVLFLAFSILEDSGYMSRIAFILDKIFRKFGLSGRAFLPMIMGFGCSVPAMINTRTLADEKEKTATIRVIPFFACGAKLPILTAVSGAIVVNFGIGNADLITYAMYVLGVVVAVVAVLFMRSTTLKGEIPPFIMELPSYHMPQFKNLMIHLFDKAKHFIKKAFTVILASTIIVWVLTHFTFTWTFVGDEEINKSILAGLCQLIQPLFTPLGFGSQLGEFGWVFVIASATGLIAKENVIAIFATVSACLSLSVPALTGGTALDAIITATNVSVPALISFIAFNMTTIPCVASVGTAKSELNNAKLFRGTVAFWLLTSFTVGCFCYTVLSVWWTVFIWITVIITALLIIRKRAKKLKG